MWMHDSHDEMQGLTALIRCLAAVNSTPAGWIEEWERMRQGWWEIKACACKTWVGDCAREGKHISTGAFYDPILMCNF
jgi:hypothetical protein